MISPAICALARCRRCRPCLPFVLQIVREKYPGVRVDVQFIGNEAMKLGLNNFALDVALTYLDKADLGRKNTLPIYTEQLSLLVPDRPEFQNRKTITWREAAQLPLAMLRPSMHERRFVDQVFKSVGCAPEARVESEIDPAPDVPGAVYRAVHDHSVAFRSCAGAAPGTRALPLVDPIVSQEVGLFWAEGEIVLPMANAFVSIVQGTEQVGRTAQASCRRPAGDRNRPRLPRKNSSAPDRGRSPINSAAAAAG